MMAAAAGIFNHAMTAAQALTGKNVTPADSSTSASGSSGSGDSDGNSATISANDFLTLLVTEMQNQDPTADTDPNEYINQLVEVNSLEQLIDINQTLSTALGGTATTSDGTAGSQAAGGGSDSAVADAAVARAGIGGVTGAATQLNKASAGAQSGVTPVGAPATPASKASYAPGNLGVPVTNAAAQRVAHTLDGRSRAQPAGARSSTIRPR
jgi:flagellar basal-body rod modification protein FlgD